MTKLTESHLWLFRLASMRHAFTASSLCWTISRRDTGKTVAQVALNWLLQRPTVTTVIIGTRNEEQLRQNLAAADWNFSPEHIAMLDTASAVIPIYPYWHQRATFGEPT